MSVSDKKQQILTRRGVIFSVAMTVPFSALLGKLYFLQVIAGKEYKRLSEENRIALKLTLPERGKIFDRDGQILADNFKAFRLVIVPERAKNPKDVLQRVGQLVTLTEEAQKQALHKMKTSLSFVPVAIKDFLDFAEVSRVQVNLPDLPGVDVDEVQARKYPQKKLASHVLGYMGPVTKEQLQATPDPLLSQPDFRVGRKGAEAHFDENLRGRAGTNHVEVNASGREVRIINEVAAKQGEDLHLSLVTAVQKEVEEKLQGRRGAIAVMDLADSTLIAMASAPTFDPNGFTYGLDTTTWQDLILNPERPLFNRCCQGVYAPGSTFKMLVALAGLEEGVITPEERIDCTGKMRFGNRDFHCWEEKGHGATDMHHAIAKSCDIYFYELGDRLGVDKIKYYANLFGLGEETGVFLPESKGLIPDEAWKRKTYGTRWQKGENLITAIGQGYVLSTPIQLLTMTARLATGFKLSPTLIKQNEPPLFEPLPFKPENLKIIQDAMAAVVTAPYGTAYGSRLSKTPLAGKTGTSQVVSRRHDKDTALKDILEHERTHALFVGYAPANAPRFATVVMLENAGSGSAAAAPMGRDALLAALKWNRQV